MLYFFYYVPLGLDVRYRRMPWMTSLLMLAIVGVSVAQRFAPHWLGVHETNFLYVPAAPRASALFLNAYLHAGVLHLVSNLVALWVFGPALEERLGAWRFVVLYHVANAAANLLQGAWSLVLLPETAEFAVLGASGAIAALMGLALVRLHFARVRVGYWAFMPLQAFTRAGAVHLAVPVCVAFWFLIQVGILVIQSQGGGAQIAVGSHLGGLVFGTGIAWLAGLRTAGCDEALIHHGRRYAGAGEWFAAQGQFASYVQQRPHDPEGHLELARALRVTHRDAEAETHYRHACARLARAGRWDQVDEVFRESKRGNPEFVLEAGMQLHLAQLYERMLQPARAEQAYLRFARHYASHDASALALFRASRLARRRGARSTARELLARILVDHSRTHESDLAHAELARLAVDDGALAA